MTHDVNGYCGISLSWYPVLSKLAVYKCKHQRDFVDSLYRQEAQLSPSDRAMRLVSSNLANCHATVQKLLKYLYDKS